MVRSDATAEELRLPPEDSLARQLGTSRSAVRIALERLTQEGILLRARRLGTRAHTTFSQQDFVGVVPSVMYNGQARAPRMRQIGARTAACPAFLEQLVGHDVEAIAIREEVGTVDGDTIYLRVSYYVGGQRDAQAVLDAFNEHVYDGFDEPEWQLPPFQDVFTQVYGERFGRSEVTLIAATSDEHIADLMGIPTGTPMMVRERLSFSDTGRLTILCVTHFRSDRVVFTFSSQPA